MSTYWCILYNLMQKLPLLPKIADRNKINCLSMKVATVIMTNLQLSLSAVSRQSVGNYSQLISQFFVLQKQRSLLAYETMPFPCSKLSSSALSSRTDLLADQSFSLKVKTGPLAHQGKKTDGLLITNMVKTWLNTRSKK